MRPLAAFALVALVLAVLAGGPHEPHVERPVHRRPTTHCPDCRALFPLQPQETP